VKQKLSDVDGLLSYVARILQCTEVRRVRASNSVQTFDTICTGVNTE